MTESTIQEQDQLRDAVRQRHAAAATRAAQQQLLAESPLPVLNTNTCCSATNTACGCASTSDNKSVSPTLCRSPTRRAMPR